MASISPWMSATTSRAPSKRGCTRGELDIDNLRDQAHSTRNWRSPLSPADPREGGEAGGGMPGTAHRP